MTTVSLDIRPATITDVDDVRTCASLAYQKYVSRMGREPAPMVADFSQQIQDGHVHIGFMEENFCGYVVFYQQAEHIHLENIAVLPAMSGHGIGKRLIGHVEQATRMAGLSAVELYTNERMIENLSWYPSLGYQEFDRKRQDGFNRVFFRKTV